MNIRSSRSPLSRLWFGVLTAFVLLGMGLFGSLWWPSVTNAASRLGAPDPVTAAWEKARAAGRYAFTSDVTQVSIPTAKITNVGRTARTDKLHLEGQNDLRQSKLALTLWSEGGSILQNESGVSVRVENGKTWARRGTGEWQEAGSLTEMVAPQGDFLAYLTAMREVTSHPTEKRNGIQFTRYSFQIDGLAFATYIHGQMEATLRAKGELPPSLQLDVPRYYRDMTGNGELWVGEDGLPLRQILTLQFPEQKEEQVHAQITVDFSQFGTPEPAVGGWNNFQFSGALGARNAQLITNSGIAFISLFAGLGLLFVVIRYGRTRKLYNGLAIAVIMSLVIGPLLTTYTNIQFFDTQTAKAAAETEQKAERNAQMEVRERLGQTEFNPHLNLMATGDAAVEASLLAPVANLPAAPALQTTDNGTDTDGDTLSDFVEERISTGPTKNDTDSDGLKDNLEVGGFTFGGQTWYSDPTAPDSNGDGQGDALEWGLNNDGSFRSTPLDSDSDGTPDLFDEDNDADGVPDNKDLAPFVKGASFGQNTPLQLKLNNLTVDKPTFVEFQLRPADEKQLWFAFNVLDWPQDREGQVQDIDGKTYADMAASEGRTPDANEANGDMKLIPMLELRIPVNGANLPPQSELTPFNISVSDFTADGATKLVYVPLNVVTDETTGQRVAFSGQMLYKPTGSWPTAHQARLAWVVQTLVDQACDPTDADDVAQGCQPDGYIHNVSQPIQSYYTDWTLTGMNVREDHGASMAIIYEDPSVDTDKKDDAALWALSYVLDHHFAIGRDTNNDGQRDLTVNEIANRFDRTRNGSYSEDQRFAVPNTLRVEKQTYATFNQAVAFTAMTETVKILDTQFKAAVTADATVKPLLFFAQESNARFLSLDGTRAPGNYVTQNGTDLTVDMAPSGQAAQSVSVLAGIKWMAYCGSTAPVTFQACTADDYLAELERRYETLPGLPEDNNDPDLVLGRLQLAQFYFIGLNSGYYGTVQEGSSIVSSVYSLDNESTTATTVRASLRGLSAVPLLASQSFARAFPVAITAGQRANIIGNLSKWGASLRESIKASSTVKGEGAIRSLKLNKLHLLRYQIAPVAAAGAALMVVTQILSLVPDIPLEARRGLGGLSIALNIAITVALPIFEVGRALQIGAVTPLQALTSGVKVNLAVQYGAVVGLALSVLVIWGFFFHSMRTGGVAAGSPELNRAFFEAVAATLVALLFAALTATLIGGIIAAIIGVIDAILTLICELGADELRTQAGLGGACFTLTTAATKYLTYLLYNYDLMINMERTDLMVTGAPKTQLADPSKGYVAGNQITLTLPVTTTLVHKDPDPANGVLINGYLYLFSPTNIRSSTFRYGLTAQGNSTVPVDLNQMTSSWQNVVEDHKYVLTPMYRGTAGTTPPPLPNLTLPVGINQTIPFTLNMSFAIPAYECWMMWIPGTPIFFPVCYEREFESANHMPINAMKFDVFPATLTEFLALTSSGDGGVRQSWDTNFRTLADGDGDGLLVSAKNGLDPNDALPDTDGDGLSDRYELEKRVSGSAYSPILRDTDNDGLTDHQEANLGTDPAIADTDNDGLKDGEEVRHLRYDGNGAPTTTWEGGWQVRINATTPFNIYVSSDPFKADGDDDGISDQAERQLALSTCTAAEVAAGNCEGNPAKPKDKHNRPYHPNVQNTPPLAVFTASDDFDGFLRPGQSFRYTTTVVANTSVVPGVLNITTPAVVGSAPSPYALDFSILPTVTQATAFAVAGNAAAQNFTLTSTVNTRLPDTGSAGWAWDAATTETGLGSFSDGKAPRFIAGAPATLERQDSYRLLGQTSTAFSVNGGAGDIWSFDIPSGGSRTVEADTNEFITPAVPDGAALRGTSSPSLACNNSGVCMAVWSEWNTCNTVTLNSLKVTGAADDPGGGIEPFITLGSTSSQNQIWRWDTAGGSLDMRPGDQRGPNAFGFPISIDFCGTQDFYIWESDGGGDQAVGNKNFSASTVQNGVTTFSGNGHTIEVNFTIQERKERGIVAALVAPDGQLQRTQFNVTAPTGYDDGNSNPVIASDGSNFLVAWQRLDGISRQLTPTQSTTALRTDLITRLFNANGDPLTGENLLPTDRLEVWASDTGSYGLDTLNLLYPRRDRLNDLSLVWIGNRYRLSRQLLLGAAATRFDVEVEENGQPGNPRYLTWRDIDGNGALIDGSARLPTFQAGVDERSGHSLAYDPATNRVLVVYHNSSNTSGVSAELYDASAEFGGPIVEQFAIVQDARNVEAVYHAPSQGYLLRWTDTTSGALRYHAFTANLTPLIAAPPQSYTWPTPINPEVGGALTCPAAQSVATVDLRFEDLPGATTFVDASGRGNNATCTGNACPAAGVIGAPNAPLSDYAVQFDGTDDGLTLNRTVQDDFSIAFWLKAPNANTQQMIVDGGSPQSNGFQIFLNNGALAINVPGFNAQAGGRIDDGLWHFIAVNRNKASGRVEAYVDGNGVIGVPGTANIALSGAADLRIGKSRTNTLPLRGAIDHLQVFPVTLSGSTIGALYNRTLQSYCVAAAVPTAGNTFPWTRLSLRQQDVRGGRITAASSLKLIVDNNAPTSSITELQNNEIIAKDLTIGGTANDPTSAVASVEVSINNGAWQAASGAASWIFSLAGYTGNVNIRTRATDRAGNVETPSAGITVRVDAAAPAVTINAPAGTVVPTKNAGGEWQVTLNGTATDNLSGVKADSIQVLLAQQSNTGQPQTAQTATLNGSNWTINYALDASLFDPTGRYTVTVQAADNLGNLTANPVASALVSLDAAGPIATLGNSDALRTVITQTVTLSGLVTDTASSVGLDKLEISFTPVEQIAALPAGINSSAAEAQLNRTWTPVSLAGRGAGQATSAWSFPVPAGLENIYQIDLRGTDMLGNVSISANLWRGMIDTRDPRMVMTATATGATYFDAASNTQQHEIRFVCAAQDRNLREESFICPGEGLAEPVRSFENNPALQILFPDLTLRTGLAISYTLWMASTTPAATANACDSFGRCATASTPGTVANRQVAAAKAAVEQTVAAAAPGAPTAVIIAPTAGDFVATNNAVSVTVAAEAGASLKEVTIKLDNTVVQTLSFAQSATVTRTLRTVNVAIANEGPHTLVAQATAWDNATQTTLYPVTFVVDKAAPTLTIDASALTIADTWQPESGILRFNGTISDSVGLAAVQIREGDNAFIDATFGGGTWRVALPVQDPEGRTLTLTVRAIDRSGRISEVTQSIATDLSAADAPDTTISSGPANPSSDNTASFVFSGSASAVVFDCQIDDGAYTPCSSPASYNDLSKGSHTFRVRAIDSRGFADVSPAEFIWTVNAGQPDATITGKPTDPTTERAANFTFSGDATATSFECRLDGSAYSACSSPQLYNNLSNGAHTFQVRGVDASNKRGAADRYTWTVLNDTPVANDQTLVTPFQVSVVVNLTATDSDPLRYKIVKGPAHGVLLGVPPSLTYSPDQGFGGVDSFTFVANDGLTDSNVATVTIYVDNVPPVSTITLAPPAPTGQNGWYTTPVQVTVSADDGTNGSGVAETRCILDPATPPTTFASIPAGCAYTGAGAEVSNDRIHTVYAASKDVAQNMESPVSKGFQIDRTPPSVTCSANPNNLWPPNNKFVLINTTVTVVDATSGPAGFTLVSVNNNETGTGDVQDWTAGTPDTQGQVLASRNGNGNGRIYTLTYRGTDVAGNSTLCSTTVTVPKSQGNGNNVTAATYDENAPREDTFVPEVVAISPTVTGTIEAIVEMPTDSVEITPTPVAPVIDDPTTLTNQLFLPLVTIDGTPTDNTSVAPIQVAPLVTETTDITPTVVVTTTSIAPIEPLDAEEGVIQFYLPLVTAE